MKERACVGTDQFLVRISIAVVAPIFLEGCPKLRLKL